MKNIFKIISEEMLNFFNRDFKEENKRFWKLTQLDRIEYNLWYRTIEERFTFHTISLIYTFIYLLFYFFTILLLIYVAFENVDLFEKIPLLVTVIKYVIFFSIIYDIFTFYRRYRAFEKLRKHYKLS